MTLEGSRTLHCFQLSKPEHFGFRCFKKAPLCLQIYRIGFAARSHRRNERICFRQLDAKLLDRQGFDENLHKGELALAFVGMSNSGKSLRSRKLAEELGFALVSVDDEIEKALAEELGSAYGNGTEALANWMGFPFQQTFREREQRYLQIEELITGNARPPQTGNFALDTTGSVVYLSDECRRKIRSEYLVVYLEIAESFLEEMIETFFACPKPVVWGESFVTSCDASNGEERLRECYPDLLRWRAERYKDLSDVTIPSEMARSVTVSSKEFLDCVRSKLPTS
jgi:shikimate kinase